MNVIITPRSQVSRVIAKVGFLAIATAVVVSPALAYADTLNRALQVGMSGGDVTALQTFLAQDPTLYPQGLVTGYFGFLTKSAVANFQSRNGIDAVGRVGPITLPVLNYQMAAGMSSNVAAPLISNVTLNVNRNNATINWYTNEAAQGLVYYSTSPLIASESWHAVQVSGNTAMTDTAFRTSQSISLQNLQSNTTYYYMIHTTDQEGGVSVTWPATFVTAN